MNPKTYFRNIEKKAIKDIEKGGRWINTSAGLYFTDPHAYAAFLAPFFDMESAAGDICRENDRQWTDGIARLFENLTKQEQTAPGETATVTAGTMQNATETKKVIMLKSDNYTQYIQAKVFYNLPDGATVKLYGAKTPAAAFYNGQLIAVYMPIKPGENSFFTEATPEKKEKKEPQSRRGYFWINTNPKPRKVNGFLFTAAGVLFGIHKNGAGRFSQWTITDIESGLSAGEKRTKAEAIKDAERIAEYLKKYKENPENAVFYAKMRDIIRKAKAEAGELDENTAKIDEIKPETAAEDKTPEETENEPKTGEIETKEGTTTPEEPTTGNASEEEETEPGNHPTTGENLPTISGKTEPGETLPTYQPTEEPQPETVTDASQETDRKQTQSEAEKRPPTEPKTAPKRAETERAEQTPTNTENARKKAKTKPDRIRGSPKNKNPSLQNFRPGKSA